MPIFPNFFLPRHPATHLCTVFGLDCQILPLHFSLLAHVCVTPPPRRCLFLCPSCTGGLAIPNPSRLCPFVPRDVKCMSRSGAYVAMRLPPLPSLLSPVALLGVTRCSTFRVWRSTPCYECRSAFRFARVMPGGTARTASHRYRQCGRSIHQIVRRFAHFPNHFSFHIVIRKRCKNGTSF